MNIQIHDNDYYTKLKNSEYLTFEKRKDLKYLESQKNCIVDLVNKHNKKDLFIKNVVLPNCIFYFSFKRFRAYEVKVNSFKVDIIEHKQSDLIEIYV